MAIHSSVLAWRIPWTEKPGGLQSMGSQELDSTFRLNHGHHCKWQELLLKMLTITLPCPLPLTLFYAHFWGKAVHVGPSSFRGEAGG